MVMVMVVVSSPRTLTNGVFDESQQHALVPLIAKVLVSQTRPSTNPLQETFDNCQAKGMESKECPADLVSSSTLEEWTFRYIPFTMSLLPSGVRITFRFREDESGTKAWMAGSLLVYPRRRPRHVRTKSREFGIEH
jgi:Zn-dependent M32 family carboxypeptidase